MEVNARLKSAIKNAKQVIQKLWTDNQIPGIVIGTSVNGETVWQEGFGYLDLENDIPCQENTVMRIASVSKCFTAVAAAKLGEKGELDWDKPVQDYLPNYPDILYNGENVGKMLTPRLLASQLGGLRHYNREKGEFERKEHYESMTAALTTFKNEPLEHKPGSNFLYSGFGFTLLGTIIENIAGKSFLVHMKEMTNYLSMNETNPDLNDVLIKNRSKCYCKNELGTILNAPYSDSSCKWSSGGYLSSVPDLIKFGNILISSYNGQNCFLKPETVKLLWTPTELSKGQVEWEPSGSYGIGFVLTYHRDYFSASHIGRATGGSAILLIIPYRTGGIVVTIIANLEKVHLQNSAKEIGFLLHSAIEI